MEPSRACPRRTAQSLAAHADVLNDGVLRFLYRSTPLFCVMEIELEDCEDVFGVGADAVVGVGFGEEDLAGGREDEGGGEGETPGVVSVDERDVDEDGAVVETNGFGDGVGDTEGVGRVGASI